MNITELNERYRIEAEIGQGGMGTVYRGYDNVLKRDVAIKVLSESVLSAEVRERLLNEARLAAKLNHPNIVSVHDAGEADGIPFIVMELVPGQSLFESRPESLEETVIVARGICAALEHAHDHGIVHRDLKPENVLRTPDETVKLTDFGLARSVTSRMTTEGLIGTLFYLAPELALGQKFDGRTDLYALGVMLYEMTTGELPFSAEDPLAVISQHIHAPVVPPRARNEDIPPALDALIVELLSKDPADRPTSAAEVIIALDSAEMLDQEAEPAEQLSVLDRIARGRLIGRQRELQEALGLWQQVTCGAGQLLMISGDPGIGKTRLRREIATHVEVTGGQVLVGECHAGGKSPYTAFAQIVRRGLRIQAENGYELPDQVLADLLLIAPELHPDHPGIEPNPRLEPEAEQRRLLENIVKFCSLLSERAHLLLVIDDLHWSDSGTLYLWRHLARRTRELPVMLLGTYREVELDEALPFYEVLLDLNRQSLGTRLKLERLDREQTRQLLAVIFAEAITPKFLEGIYRETEGNPFFIKELCKALVESGEVYYVDGKWDRPANIQDIVIPQGVKVTIQSRVKRLAPETQGVLLNAAVIGREFDYQTLQQVTEGVEEDIINSLEEALRAQMIEELKGRGGERFTFSHAMVPAVLRGSISGLRRNRLHRKVALAIEALHPREYESLVQTRKRYSGKWYS